MDAELIN